MHIETNFRFLKNSDLLCRMIISIGFFKKRLYSDDHDTVYKFKHPIGINRINFASVEPDFFIGL
jgi:hypothetical protein